MLYAPLFYELGYRSNVKGYKEDRNNGHPPRLFEMISPVRELYKIGEAEAQQQKRWRLVPDGGNDKDKECPH
jgi:hypothetical protein